MRGIRQLGPKGMESSCAQLTTKWMHVEAAEHLLNRSFIVGGTNERCSTAWAVERFHAFGGNIGAVRRAEPVSVPVDGSRCALRIGSSLAGE